MPQPDPLVGKTFEKVRLLEKLGAGGQGTVYLAEHATLGQKVAVKILPEHLSRDPEYVSRFMREAETAARLEHPNIVQVHDIGFADGKYFITMQYVEGESLQTIIKAMAPLDPRDAAKVAIGILRGLHYAHSSGIVHRDIKPDNVLIDRKNEPRILDFGLAIETESTLKLTAAGTVVGTPWFISPEQARGRGADTRSDLYSLGVTVYYMLTGRVPFQGQTALAVLNKHINEQPVSPTTLNPRIPPVLEAIVLKLLSKKPDERYLTAETAARDLEAFLENRPISMASASTQQRVVKRRGPVPWIAGGVIAMAVVLLTIAAVNAPSSAGPRRTPPSSPTAVPLDGAAREEIETVRRKVGEVQRDLEQLQADVSVFPHLHQRYQRLRAQYANNPDAVAIIDEAVKALLDRAEARAQPEARRIEDEAQALLPADPYGALAAYGRFPRPLLELTPSGRSVAEARAKLETRLQKEFPSRLEELQSLIAKQDFEGARARARYLLDHVAAHHQPRLRELVQKADEEEAAQRRRLMPGLVAAVLELQKALLEPLRLGRTGDAWKQLLGFLAARPPDRFETRLLRAPDVDYADLQAFHVQEAVDADLDRALAAMERRPTDRDDACYQLLTLFDDVLRREWLHRRVLKGIARLSGEPFELASLGRVRGRLTAGEPPSITPPDGPPQTFNPRELTPFDVVSLAAAADYGAPDPASQAFRSSARLCAAAGAAYLHSTARDRFHAARRWLAQARELGASVPRHRLDAMAEGVEIENQRLTREIFAPAHALLDQKKFEEAQRALDEIQRKYGGQDAWETIAPLVDVHRAKFLLREASAAKDARDWTRVRDIVLRQLRARYEGSYPREAGDRLYHEAILNLGSWQPAPIPSIDLAKSRFWTWDRKDEGAAPPARLVDGGLRLTRNIAMRCASDMTQGHTGMSAKFKLNEHRTVFSAGIRFDIAIPNFDELWLLAKSTGELEFEALQRGQIVPRETAELPAKIALNEWHEVAWVAEGGEIVLYFDRQPLIVAQGDLARNRALGLWAEGDFTFKDIKIRDMKPR